MPSVVDVKIMRLSHSDGLDLPAYQSTQAAGMDLVAAVPDDVPVTLAPGRPRHDRNRDRNRPSGRI